MPIHICNACGTSFPNSKSAPKNCPICEDDRQYVPADGQTWTTLENLVACHSNMWKLHEPNLYEIKTHPNFGIGQRTFLIRTSNGNILWDCVSLLDPVTEEIIHALGGISAIAISHPHFYTTMQDWAQAFDAPVYLHKLDCEWVMRPDEKLIFWEGEKFEMGDGLSLIRIGGHFPGATVLHWPQGADGQGVLFTGDIIQVAADNTRVSFMHSYPNMLPLAAVTVQRIGDVLALWDFDRIYGAFDGKTILSGAKKAIKQSVSRYVGLLEGNQM
ncbi:MBL fold metallo-hydrolase [Psychrobacter urativorans]|uniref:MBL fold metallo-hydrolase n=1 Tax=Psychrobacter urativorans TaxID=45610 RepID=UPI00191B4391|nr:MBL fold metallo-hydrolase [Psychrobacter urativorans]